MISASPYLNFPGNTEEAFTYYKSVFGGEFTSVTRFRDMGDNPWELPRAISTRSRTSGSRSASTPC